MNITTTTVALTLPQVDRIGWMSGFTDSGEVRVSAYPTPEETGMVTIAFPEGEFYIAPNGDTFRMFDGELILTDNPGAWLQ